METIFKVTQIQEGSLLFKRDFGVNVENNTRASYQYVYMVYESDVLQSVSEKISENLYFFKPQKYGAYKVTVDIYEGSAKIQRLVTPILDFFEDFVLVKETQIKYEDGEVLVTAIPEFDMPKLYYAFYLLKNNGAIEKIFYTKQPWYKFRVTEPGEYCVQVFLRLIKNSGVEDKVITRTEPIKIE